MELVKEVYRLTRLLPDAEKFGLGSQMQRAAVSVPSNIAEGFARKSTKDYMRYLRIACGSAAELETQLLVARDVYDLNISDAESLLHETEKMLASVTKILATRS